MFSYRSTCWREKKRSIARLFQILVRSFRSLFCFFFYLSSSNVVSGSERNSILASGESKRIKPKIRESRWPVDFTTGSNLFSKSFFVSKDRPELRKLYNKLIRFVRECLHIGRVTPLPEQSKTDLYETWDCVFKEIIGWKNGNRAAQFFKTS